MKYFFVFGHFFLIAINILWFFLFFSSTFLSILLYFCSHNSWSPAVTFYSFFHFSFVGVFSFPFLPWFSLLAVLGGLFCFIFFPAYLVLSVGYGLVLGYGVGVSCKHSLFHYYFYLLWFCFWITVVWENWGVSLVRICFSLYSYWQSRYVPLPHLGGFERKSLFLNASLEFT